jgi:hypothetical protein
MPDLHRAGDDEITPGELRRWLQRIEATIQNLVSQVEHRELVRRVAEIEDDAKSKARLIFAALVGVVLQSVIIAYTVKGGVGQ